MYKQRMLLIELSKGKNCYQLEKIVYTYKLYCVIEGSKVESEKTKQKQSLSRFITSLVEPRNQFSIRKRA